MLPTQKLWTDIHQAQAEKIQGGGIPMFHSQFILAYSAGKLFKEKVAPKK